MRRNKAIRVLKRTWLEGIPRLNPSPYTTAQYINAMKVYERNLSRFCMRLEWPTHSKPCIECWDLFKSIEKEERELANG